MKAFHPYFLPTLVTHYQQEAGEILARMDQLYTEIYDTSLATSKNPIDKRLSFSAYFLAMIQCLDEKGESYERIRQVCLLIANDFVQPKNSFQRLIKKWPSYFVQTWLGKLLIQNLKKEVEKPGHPDGFVARIITDKNATHGLGYGIDILECGICKQFQKQNYTRFTSILCEVDHMTTSLAGLEMFRQGTIALGAPICDFRYKLKK
ncbi:L-2-amino-thiazoline-4-carboxylic acid hydrolase [Aquirufa nivalisilvae]